MMYAICLAGHTRGYDVVMSNSNSLLENMNADFYISTWQKNGLSKVFWSGDSDEEGEQIDTDSLLQLYKPITIDIQNKSDYSMYSHFDFELKTEHHVNVLNTILMFKKIKKSIHHAINSTNTYDIIFRSRFDLEDLNLPSILECNKDTLYCKQSPNNGFVSDCFFYGHPDTMLKSIPDETFYTEDIIDTSLNAEEIFSRYIQSQNIKIQFVDNLSFRVGNTTYR